MPVSITDGITMNANAITYTYAVTWRMHVYVCCYLAGATLVIPACIG